jgi:thiol:disulfide interchange protein DsbA
MMRVLSLFGMIAPLTLAPLSSMAQVAVLDQEYKLITPPQPTATGPQNVEVVEVFSYGCPHCFAFEPQLKKWKAGKPKDAQVSYMPAMFGESQAPAAKLFYTIEEMGLVEKLHEKIYDEVHVKHNTAMLSDSALMAKFLATQGVDEKRFLEIFDSFGVANKVSRAAQMMRSYRISGTPSVVVNGKYLTGPSMTMGADGVDHGRFFTVLDQLINMEQPKKKEAKNKKKEKTTQK